MAQAQINNLVPNPSFEDTVHCPDNMAQIDNAEHWFQPLPNGGTSDYYHLCSNLYNIITDLQTPRTGGAYAGIILYGGNWREYIEVKLNEPLVANQEYCIEFYVSLLEFSYSAIDAVGMYISTDSIFTNNSIVMTLPYLPQINNPVNNILIDSLGWMRVSGTYIAAGEEQFITIGNFHLTGDFNIVTLPGVQASYYLIDDVAVYLCDDTIPKPPKELNMPNVFSPNNDEWNNQFTIENLPEGATVEIYNRWGALVAEWNTPNGSWDGRTKGGAESSAGVYYCLVKLVNGELKSSFLQLLR